jgi:hypothetical protein
MSGKREIVYSDHSRGDQGDFPVAVVYTQEVSVPGTATSVEVNEVCDPIFNTAITKNLYGRLMTLIEATTDRDRMKAVKNLFSKELSSWEDDVYRSARELASNGDSSHNLYTRSSF